MVRELRKKSFKDSMRAILLSPFILPILTFAFVMTTLPIVLFLVQQQQDIRQRAAVSSGPIAIDTDQISYGKATAEVVSNDSIGFVVLVSALVIIGVLSLVVVVYRRRLAAY